MPVVCPPQQCTWSSMFTVNIGSSTPSNRGRIQRMVSVFIYLLAYNKIIQLRSIQCSRKDCSGTLFYTDAPDDTLREDAVAAAQCTVAKLNTDPSLASELFPRIAHVTQPTLSHSNETSSTSTPVPAKANDLHCRTSSCKSHRNQSCNHQLCKSCCVRQPSTCRVPAHHQGKRTLEPVTFHSIQLNMPPPHPTATSSSPSTKSSPSAEFSMPANSHKQYAMPIAKP